MVDKNAQLKDLFSRYDRDGNGSINCDELRDVLKALGNFQESEIRCVFSHIDRNSDGAIQVREFVDWILRPRGDAADDKAKAALAGGGDGLEQCFYNFCGHGHTDMDGKSFQKLCKDLGLINRRFTATDVDLLFTKSLVKGRRRIDFRQFEDVLARLAPKTGVDVADLRQSIIDKERPTVEGTEAGDVRLADQKNFTGTAACNRASTFNQGQSEVAERPERRTRTEPRPTAGGRLPSGQGSMPPAGDEKAVYSLPQPPAREPVYTWQEVFDLYSHSHKDGIEGRGFAKLCRDCGIVDRRFTTGMADALFSRICERGHKRMSESEFGEALYQIAEMKHMDYGDILEAVAKHGGPSLQGTRAEATRFHDDKSTYTGSHR